MRERFRSSITLQKTLSRITSPLSWIFRSPNHRLSIKPNKQDSRAMGQSIPPTTSRVSQEESRSTRPTNYPRLNDPKRFLGHSRLRRSVEFKREHSLERAVYGSALISSWAYKIVVDYYSIKQ